jgi:PPM family protein phosphatase
LYGARYQNGSYLRRFGVFDTELITDKGGRSWNEDACGSTVVGTTNCWVVADGLGGHSGGQVASQLAVDAVIESFRRDPAVSSTAMNAHFQAAHNTILDAQVRDTEVGQMQSTLVILISDGRTAIWGHIGDSRLYHFREGKIVFCTRDHSVSQLKVDTGDLDHDGIRRDIDRNRLLQAAGKKDRFAPTVLEEPKELCRGDAFLLCADGFWEKVAEVEMEIDFVKSKASSDWLANLRRRLIERLGSNSDNYTIIAVRATSLAMALPKTPKMNHARITRKRSAHPLFTISLYMKLSILAAMVISSMLVIRLHPYFHPVIRAKKPAENRSLEVLAPPSEQVDRGDSSGTPAEKQQVLVKPQEKEQPKTPDKKQPETAKPQKKEQPKKITPTALIPSKPQKGSHTCAEGRWQVLMTDAEGSHDGELVLDKTQVIKFNSTGGAKTLYDNKRLDLKHCALRSLNQRRLTLNLKDPANTVLVFQLKGNLKFPAVVQNCIRDATGAGDR